MSSLYPQPAQPKQPEQTPLPAEPVLFAEGIGHVYHDGTRELEILREVNLAVEEGESVAIIGRSGTGKTTLLNILGLLDNPTRGQLIMAGKNTAGLSERERTRMRAEHIGFVFQQYHLIAELNALENIELTAGFAGTKKIDARERARELLDQVGLSERATHRPAKLSGGERQRVAIARALLNRPNLLLCDEPTGNLDPHTSETVMNIFWDVVRQSRTSMILVTHDQQVAKRADRILTLSEGRLQ